MNNPVLYSTFRIAEMSAEGGSRAEEQGEDEWLKDFHLHQTIAAGLDHDIQRLLAATVARFEAIGGPRFDQFTEVWRETGFGLVFQGRESFRELHEFTEELVARAKALALVEVVARASCGLSMLRPCTALLLSSLFPLLRRLPMRASLLLAGLSLSTTSLTSSCSSSSSSPPIHTIPSRAPPWACSLHQAPFSAPSTIPCIMHQC